MCPQDLPLAAIQVLHQPTCSSDLIVMEHEVDIPWPLRVVPNEIVVSLGSLLLGVTREHALQTDANALHVVYRRPALSIE